MAENMKVLVNCFGIKNSGGVTVLRELVLECQYLKGTMSLIFLVSDRDVYESLKANFKDSEICQVKFVAIKNNLHRLIFENLRFKKIITESGSTLIYNFTGSHQFFLKTPQLLKMQNLLFYSKALDKAYAESQSFVVRVKNHLLKAWVFRYMLSKARFVEVQAHHVAQAISDYVDLHDKKVFIKGDTGVLSQPFRVPVIYDFSRPIKFLYVVGPHFESLHKNLLDFTSAMLHLMADGIDFEIHITLDSRELNRSKLWDDRLNSRTHFHGYVTEPSAFDNLFCSNTILISTSIIETIGLHVVEAIQRGVIVVTPAEDYAKDVYGPDLFSYQLFNAKSLQITILEIIDYSQSHDEIILKQQARLVENENSKYNSSVSIFKEVINV